MGICYWDAKMLWEAHLSGVSFDQTLTIGHQSLSLHPSELKYFRTQHKSAFPDADSKPLDGYQFRDYSDEFLHQFLDVKSLSIMDYSEYEGADVIHDLNEPVPQELHERFDAVIDGGSLEHIFNFPVAIANLMKMLKVGGSIFIAIPANNLCGHGFYQFSPELMFRIFAKENGFETKRIVMNEARYPAIDETVNHRAYEVADPIDVRGRVGLISKGPVTMIVEAQKTASVTPFATPPLQSDYVTQWNEDPPEVFVPASPSLKRRFFNMMPNFLKVAVRKVQLAGYIRFRRFLDKRSFSFSNKRFYKRL